VNPLELGLHFEVVRNSPATTSPLFTCHTSEVSCGFVIICMSPFQPLVPTKLSRKNEPSKMASGAF
jgi:hypothetical protein